MGGQDAHPTRKKIELLWNRHLACSDAHPTRKKIELLWNRHLACSRKWCKMSVLTKILHHLNKPFMSGFWGPPHKKFALCGTGPKACS